jgi:hypothetical protein
VTGPGPAPSLRGSADPREVQRVSPATAPLWLEVPSRVEGGRVSLDERIAALRGLGAG